MPSVERALAINTSVPRLYDAFLDLDRWPEWNPHMREVRCLDTGPLAVGSRARIVLKSGFPSTWQVTELHPGRSFAWTSRLAPGLRATFNHIVESGADDSAVATLRLDVAGPLAVGSFPVLAFYGRNLVHSLRSLKRTLEGAKPAGTTD